MYSIRVYIYEYTLALNFSCSSIYTHQYVNLHSCMQFMTIMIDESYILNGSRSCNICIICVGIECGESVSHENGLATLGGLPDCSEFQLVSNWFPLHFHCYCYH